MKKYFGLIGLFLTFSIAASAVELPKKFVLPSSEPQNLAYFALSHDRQTIAIRGPTYIQIWDIPTQTLTKTISELQFVPSSPAIKQMEFTPDDKNIVEQLYFAPNIVVMNVESGKMVFEKTVTGTRTYDSLFRFSPSGEEILIYDANLGYADLINMKTWSIVSTIFIGKSGEESSGEVNLFTGLFFVDKNTLLVKHYNSALGDGAANLKVLKYNIGTNEVTKIPTATDFGYTIQISPAQFVVRTSINASNYEAFLFDLADNSITKFYQNDFLPPQDSPKPLAGSIDTMRYNPNTNTLLIGTSSFSSMLPKGLRFINMKTKKASPSFDFNSLEFVNPYNNGQENYIVGINRGKKNPAEGGIQFIKIVE